MPEQPMVPVTGTAWSGPLVDNNTYRFIMEDISADEDHLTELLEQDGEVEEDLCRELKRTVRYAQYDENCYLSRTGMVYPTAPPIDPTRPITTGMGDNIYDPTQPSAQNNPGSVIQGHGVWVGWFTPLPWMPAWTGVIRPQTNVRYYGGFSGDGSVGRKLPNGLQRIIAKSAWFRLHPAILEGMPMGGTSQSVGGVSLGGAVSSAALRDPDLHRQIQRWTLRRHPRW